MGIGKDPPARKFAGLPLSVVRLGSARLRAKFMVRRAWMAMSTLPLSMEVGRLPAMPPTAPTGPPLDLREAEGPLGDAEIHADRACRGAIHFGHRDHEHDLLLAGHPQEVDQIRVSRQELANGIDRRGLVAQPGDEIHVDVIRRTHGRPSSGGRMFGDDAEDLCRLDDVLALAADHDLLAHQRELDRAVGKGLLDFSFQDLERLLEGLHLGLQTLSLCQHVQRSAFRIGQDHDHVAQGPVLLRVVGIARIREPEVEDRRALLLADDGYFLVGDDLNTGHVFVGDVDAARLLAQDDHLGPAYDHLDRVLRGDLALDELPILSLDLRRRLGDAQSRRKPQRRQTELSRVERRPDSL